MIFLGISLLFSQLSFANEVPPTSGVTSMDRLVAVRQKINALEQSLADGIRLQKDAKIQLLKIRKLILLQKAERNLGKQRMNELEKTIVLLEERRTGLKEKISRHQKQIRKYLLAVENSSSLALMQDKKDGPGELLFKEREQWELPRKKVLTNLVERGLKEVEALRVDLGDSAQLEARIEEERHHLAYLFQDLDEQQSVLELNQKLQTDFLSQSKKDRVEQLLSYRNLKQSEEQIEQLLQGFNARMELQSNLDKEKQVARSLSQAQAMARSQFALQKGKLPFPVLDGKIISQFGRVFDPASSLYIFKKGIDIAAGKNDTVRAVSEGRVAFAGEMPTYGQVVIVDHGDHYYSLCAHLGTVSKKQSEWVKEGDPIGLTDGSGTPIYFEIRVRNVAVNPLQWLFN